MVPYPEGALGESGRVRCGGDAIGFWERNCSGQARGRGSEMGRSGEESPRVLQVPFPLQCRLSKPIRKIVDQGTQSNISNFAVAL